MIKLTLLGYFPLHHFAGDHHHPPIIRKVYFYGQSLSLKRETLSKGVVPEALKANGFPVLSVLNFQT